MDNIEKDVVVTNLIEHISSRIPYMRFLFELLEVHYEDDKIKLLDDAGLDICTDGIGLFIGNSFFRLYDKAPKECEKQLLHELFHIFLGHPYLAKGKDRDENDLKCDREVERYLSYQYAKKDGFDGIRTRSSEILKYDQMKHDVWYVSESGKETSKNDGTQNGTRKEKETQEGEAQEGAAKESEDRSEKEQKIRELCRNMRFLQDYMDEETRKNVNFYGSAEGMSEERMQQTSGKPVSYEDYLRSYINATDVKGSEEEMDLVMYAYGMDLYEDVAWIEPPETTEKTRISFCMAIDTSGSCDREKVGEFFSQTKTVLDEIKQMGCVEMNIYIFVCDTRIHQEFHVTGAEQFPKGEDIVLTGGGTNFIPVFRRIEKLISEKKIDPDTGLFYFSDGYGRFPRQKSKYEILFWL